MKSKKDPLAMRGVYRKSRRKRRGSYEILFGMQCMGIREGYEID